MDWFREQAALRGSEAAAAVRTNLDAFWKTADAFRLRKERVLLEAEELLRSLPDGKRMELYGIAEGAGCRPSELMAFNVLGPRLQPEGCTVYFAAGKSSAAGTTIIGKNSDKGGDLALTGDLCVNFHEINVVSWMDNEDGSHVVGISAAGSTGIKMGMNSHGVVGSTNYGYSRAARKKTLSQAERFAGDRAQIARDSLQKRTALEAAQYAAARLLAHPMASSGMLEFADADAVYIVENVYDYLAIRKITDAVDSRSNYFVTLDYLNEAGSATCYCRYHRSQQLLREIDGHATAEDLKRISMDHHDGTGTLGICRHVDGLDSSTQAAAVMEPKREPEKSVIHMALGKPCNAWRYPDGNISIRMDQPREAIPEAFRRGDPYLKYGFAEPVLSDADCTFRTGDIA